MKTKKLIEAMFAASLSHNKEEQKKLYKKILKKSLKGKKTNVVK